MKQTRGNGIFKVVNDGQGEKKLNRGKIIRKCVGEGLSDLGFLYGGCDAGDTWVFERKQGELIWYVYIYVYRFDRWQVTFHFNTNVPGNLPVMAGQVKGVRGNGDMKGYWRFHDEESLTRVLEEMVRVIRIKGIQMLEELSVPPKVTSYDNKMHSELYLHHKELAEAFVERTGMIATGYDGDNLKRWFDYIDSRIEEMNRGEYDDAAKKELTEIAAFLGEQIEKYKGGVWKLVNNETVFITYMKKPTFMKKPIEFSINMLSLLVGRYLGNSRGWLEEEFYKVIEE